MAISGSMPAKSDATEVRRGAAGFMNRGWRSSASAAGRPCTSPCSPFWTAGALSLAGWSSQWPIAIAIAGQASLTAALPGAPAMPRGISTSATSVNKSENGSSHGAHIRT